MFIKLTSHWVDVFSPIYIKPESIEAMDRTVYRETSYTNVRVNGYGFDVKETPEEILKMIADSQQIP